MSTRNPGGFLDGPIVDVIEAVSDVSSDRPRDRVALAYEKAETYDPSYYET